MTTSAIPATRPATAATERPPGWWGMVLLIATEATLFALLLATYFYLRFQTPGSWPPDGIHDPKVLEPLLATIVLVASSMPLALAVRAAERRNALRARAGLAVAIALAVAFLIFQHVLVNRSLDTFEPRTDAYGSIFYTLVGVHAAHVVVGVLLAAWTLLRSRRFDGKAALAVRVTGLYWQFVNVVSVVVFVVLYLSPRG